MSRRQDYRQTYRRCRQVYGWGRWQSFLCAAPSWVVVVLGPALAVTILTLGWLLSEWSCVLWGCL